MYFTRKYLWNKKMRERNKIAFFFFFKGKCKKKRLEKVCKRYKLQFNLHPSFPFKVLETLESWNVSTKVLNAYVYVELFEGVILNKFKAKSSFGNLFELSGNPLPNFSASVTWDSSLLSGSEYLWQLSPTLPRSH